MQIEEHHLSNGIPVLFHPSEGFAAATYWWVRTGSIHEKNKQEGFAHFLEHMLFKDTDAKASGRASSGKLAQSIESLGGEINAYTSFEQTVYHCTCAEENWESVIDTFGSIAQPIRFLKTDFEREREVILEEIRRNEDSPERQMFQSLFSKSFKSHPYGRPVIGYAKNLKAAKVQDLEAFYRTNYSPSLFGLLLVGPYTEVRKKSILKILEKRFGSKLHPKGKAEPERKPILEPEFRSKEDFFVRHLPIQSPVISFSMRVPGWLGSETAALDLASGILGMGESSRLHQELFQKQGLVTDVGASLFSQRENGLFYFQASMENADKLEKTTDAIFTTVKKLADELPTEDEISRVIINTESEKQYSLQTVDGIASQIGYLKFVAQDLLFNEKYLQRLKNTKAEDIRGALHGILDPRRLSFCVFLPENLKNHSTADVKATVLKHVSKQAPVKKVTQKSGLLSHASMEKRTSGIQLVRIRRESSPVFSAHLSYLAGSRLEQVPGSASVLSQLWTQGTKTKNSKQLSEKIEGMASSIGGFSGRNSNGLEMTGLVRDFEPLSEIFQETFLDPSFPVEELAHIKRVSEDSIKSIADHSSQLCMKMFLETLFENHPYGRLLIGDLRSLASINQDTIRDLHRLSQQPNKLTLCVSGSVTDAQIESFLKPIESKLAQTIGTGTSLKSPAAESALKAPRWIEKNLGREQRHIVVGGFGTQIGSPDRHALKILLHVLSGQSGRLFIELREKKSLAYSVSPIHFEGLEPGYLGIYIACSPEKQKEAIDGIRVILEDLAKKGPKAHEMERAKEFYLGRRSLDLQSDPALASHFGLQALYGFSPEVEIQNTKLIREVSITQVKRVCQKYFVEPHQVTSVV